MCYVLTFVEARARQGDLPLFCNTPDAQKGRSDQLSGEFSDELTLGLEK